MSKNIAISDEVYERLKRGDRPDDLHDVYIGATARTKDLPVLTGTVSDFERIDDIQVIDWNSF